MGGGDWGEIKCSPDYRGHVCTCWSSAPPPSPPTRRLASTPRGLSHSPVRWAHARTGTVTHPIIHAMLGAHTFNVFHTITFNVILSIYCRLKHCLCCCILNIQRWWHCNNIPNLPIILVVGQCLHHYLTRHFE